MRKKGREGERGEGDGESEKKLINCRVQYFNFSTKGGRGQGKEGDTGIFIYINCTWFLCWV